MKITAINITTTPNYEKDKFGEYVGRESVNNEYAHNASININLSAEQMAVIVPIIAQAVSQNMADAANAFAESVQASLAPPIEHRALTLNSNDGDDALF